MVTWRGRGWRYDVTTGNVMHVPDFGIATYEAKVHDGKIQGGGQPNHRPQQKKFGYLLDVTLAPISGHRAIAAAAAAFREGCL